MPILGAHMSIAGGLSKSVERAKEFGCDCVQLFTTSPKTFPKPPAHWPANAARKKGAPPLRPLAEDEVELFQTSLTELNITHPIAHDSYLINLATPNDALWTKSIDAYVIELLRAEQLGLAYVVMHPGAHTTATEEQGIERVIKAFDEVHRRTGPLKVVTLVETTAGQGTCLGHKFEHLGAIIAGVAAPERLAICVDTCHIFSAGYPIGTSKEYETTMKSLDKHVGVDRVRAFHLNDSKKGLGCRVDRHTHIGRGELGLEPFRNLLNDPRFTNVPMYLETPKEQIDGEEMDLVNLRVLRGLMSKSKKPKATPLKKPTKAKPRS